MPAAEFCSTFLPNCISYGFSRSESVPVSDIRRRLGKPPNHVNFFAKRDCVFQLVSTCPPTGDVGPKCRQVRRPRASCHGVRVARGPPPPGQIGGYTKGIITTEEVRATHHEEFLFHELFRLEALDLRPFSTNGNVYWLPKKIFFPKGNGSHEINIEVLVQLSKRRKPWYEPGHGKSLQGRLHIQSVIARFLE